MKIRSIYELSEFLDEDLFWRKRELTALRFELAEARAHASGALTRMGICVLYAHWEGFVKSASTAYLNYVALRGHKVSELADSIRAACLRQSIREAGQSNKVSLYVDLLRLIESSQSGKASIPWDSVVDTGSNLNSELFKEIANLIGVPYENYAPKENLIDESLLAARNKVAHGNRVEITSIDFSTIYPVVIGLLESYRNDVENAALEKRFLNLAAPSPK